MAGINLAGAIGMTGKRESVLSDLPKQIEGIGDFLGQKNLLELKQRQEAAQQAKEAQQKKYDAIDKSVSVDINTSIPEHRQEYLDEAIKAKKGLYDAYQKMSPAEFSMYSQKVLNDLAAKKQHIEEDSKLAHAAAETDRNIYNMEDFDNQVVKGNFLAEDVTPAMEGAQVPERAITAPMEGATGNEQAPESEYRIGTPYLAKPLEERMKEAPYGAMQKFGNLVKLKKGDFAPALEAALGTKTPEKAWVLKTTIKNANGLDEYAEKEDKDKIVKDGSVFVANVMNSKDPSILQYRNSIIEPLYKEAYNRGIKTPQELKEFVDEGVKQKAFQDYMASAQQKVAEELATRRKDLDPYKTKTDTNEGGWKKLNGVTYQISSQTTEKNPDLVLQANAKVKEAKQWLDDNASTIQEAETYLKNHPNGKGSEPSKYAEHLETQTQANLKRKQVDIFNKTANEVSANKQVDVLNIKNENVKLNVDGADKIVDVLGYSKDSNGNIKLSIKIPLESNDGNKTFQEREIAYNPKESKAIDPKTIAILQHEGWLDSNNQPVKSGNKNYGNRIDGTKKGSGWLGELKMKDGSNDIATELSISPKINGKTTLIPSLVPTLNKEEIDWLLKNGMKSDDQTWESSIARSIENKAIAHAKKRMAEGKSVWADETKSVPSQPIENETETVLKSMVTEDKHDKVIGEYQKSKELELIHGEDWLPMQLKGTNVTPKEVKVVSKKHNVDEKKVVAVIKSSKKENLTTSNWKTNVDKIAQGLSKKQIKTDSIHDKYDIRSYATAPNHEKIVDNVYKNIKHLETKEDIDNYIKDKSVGSNITGSMILNTAKKYDVEPQAIIALIQIDSSFGTKGKGARTNNPGNVGNDDSGRTVTYKTWQDGVDAVGAQLAKRKIQKEYIPSQPKKKSKKATDYGL